VLLRLLLLDLRVLDLARPPCLRVQSGGRGARGAGSVPCVGLGRGELRQRPDLVPGENVLRWQRSSPELSQRVLLAIADDGRTIFSKGEMSKNGGVWKPDLEVTYSRVA
jgi:hypothetical protein